MQRRDGLDQRRNHPGPCWHRLHSDVALQRALDLWVGCGSRPTGEVFVRILDENGIEPAALDVLLEANRLDPKVILFLGADRFPAHPPHAVPAAVRRRAAG